MSQRHFAPSNRHLKNYETDPVYIPTFVFEAFDEEWKGSHHPLEPEKHWGLFKIDRTPKLVMEHQYTPEKSI